MENWNGRVRNPRDYKIGWVGAFSFFVLALLAGAFGTQGLARKDWEPIRANDSYHDGTEGASQWPRSDMIGWARRKIAQRCAHEEKYAQAMILTNEVEQKMRECAAAPDPFRAIMADIWFQNHDMARVTDAFEASQESHIFEGLSK
jgi:hypothetical protein